MTHEVPSNEQQRVSRSRIPISPCSHSVVNNVYRGVVAFRLASVGFEVQALSGGSGGKGGIEGGEATRLTIRECAILVTLLER